MRKIKLIFIGIILILLTGCSGNYNLTINKDMSVNEELEISINDSSLYNKTLKIFEENNIPRDNYEVNINENKVYIKYKDTFNSIEDYILNSKVYSQLFDKIEYNRTNKYIDLYTSSNLKLKNDYTLTNGSNLQDLDVIQVNITNPYKVVLTNAEISNDNTYTWTIKKENGIKKIQMQFKPSLSGFPYKAVIVISVIIIVTLILVVNVYRKIKKSQRF